MIRYRVQDYYDAINGFAPFSLAMDFDNVGLLIGSGEREVRSAVLALDATVEVVANAKSIGADLIIAHHPVIFHPLKRVEAGSAVYEAIAAGLSVICAHTNLDIARGGVNDVLAGLLELGEVTPLEIQHDAPYYKLVVFVPEPDALRVEQALSDAGAGVLGNYKGVASLAHSEGHFTPLPGAHPYLGAVGAPERVSEIRLEVLVAPDKLDDAIAAMRRQHPFEEPGYDVYETHAVRHREAMGRVGELAEPMEPEAFAHHVKNKLGIGGVQLVPGKEPVRRVAVCGGSAAEYLGKAQAAGAQALVIGEGKHSTLLEARQRGMTLVLAGHHATEAPAMTTLLAKLEELLPGASLQLSTQHRDPAVFL